MKLNPDCVREVLIYIEENTFLTMDEKLKPIKHTLWTRPLLQHCEEKGLSAEDTFYALYQMVNNGYIDASPETVGGEIVSYTIRDLTLRGHELLDSVRSEEMYSKVKDVAAKIGGTTLETMAYIGKNVLLAFVKGELHFS